MTPNQIEPRASIPRGFFDDRGAWRHHGLGVLQREIDTNKRVHVWHPDLRFIEGLRAVHDHRFDLSSTVVYGAITDERWDICQPHRARCNAEAWSIQHAKIQTPADNAGFLYKVNARPLASFHHTVGATYHVPRRHFHTTCPGQLAITIVERFNFDGNPARILMPIRTDGDAPESAISNAHGDNVRDPKTIAEVLAEAKDAIS